MKEFMNITKALGDENRVRILMMLRQGELCVCQVIEMLRLAPSTVSKHLAVLRQAGLIESRKDGRWVYYHLPDGEASATALALVEWIKKSLSHEKRILADDQNLLRVKEICLEDLCEHYGNGQRGNGMDGIDSEEDLLIDEIPF